VTWRVCVPILLPVTATACIAVTLTLTVIQQLKVHFQHPANLTEMTQPAYVFLYTAPHSTILPACNITFGVPVHLGGGGQFGLCGQYSQAQIVRKSAFSTPGESHRNDTTRVCVSVYGPAQHYSACLQHYIWGSGTFRGGGAIRFVWAV